MKAHNRKDMTGMRYGKLVVVEYSHTDEKRQAIWRCVCDCGKEKLVPYRDLHRGDYKSCGCGKGKGSTRLGNRLPKGESLINSLYSNYKLNAKNRDLVFDLSKDEFSRLINLNCFYCGVEPSGIKSARGCIGTMVYNGIDRLDSDIGYILENVVPCCKQCNIAKNNTPYKSFKDWIFRVSDYMNSKKISYAK